MIQSQPIHSEPKRSHFNKVLTNISYWLRAIWLFFPSILFILLAFAVFVLIEQGRDLMIQSLVLPLDKKGYIVLGLFFWSFTTWYTTRILAYNDNDTYEKYVLAVRIMPRLVGYLVPTVMGLALYRTLYPDGWPWVFIISSAIVFVGVAWMVSGKKTKTYTGYFGGQKIWMLYLLIVGLGMVLVWITWRATHVPVALFGLFLVQSAAVFWVSFRRKSPVTRPETAPRSGKVRNSKFYQWAFSRTPLGQFIRFCWRKYKSIIKLIYEPKLRISPKEEQRAFLNSEYPIFFAYNLFALFGITIYFTVVLSIDTGRIFGSLTFILLAFAILLGMGNIIALLSFRRNINLHFFILSTMLIWGQFCEPHQVRVIDLTEKNAYSQRPDFKTYLHSWLNAPERQKYLRDPGVDSFPVFFILADGGASRSGYWTANALSYLHQKTLIDTGDSYFSRHLLALAGASGGSVGNVTFFASLKAQREAVDCLPDSLCNQYLSSDFLTFPLARLLGPELINLGQWGDRAAALERSMEQPQNRHLPDMNKLTEIISGDFKQFLPIEKENTWVKPILCVNTTCMQDGQPGLIVNIKDSLFYPRLDVLDLMECRKGIRVSTAMVLGARFPFFSPAGKLSDRYYVDGGYFDNSGGGPILQLIFELEALKQELTLQGDTSFLARSLQKMTYHVIHLQNTPLKGKKYKKIPPLSNDLAAPLITLMGSYGAQTNFNDHRLKNYLKQVKGVYYPVNLYKDKKETYPMNWVLSNIAISNMKKRVKQHGMLENLVNELSAADYHLKNKR